MTDNADKINAEYLAEELFDANDPTQVNQRKQRIARGKKEHLNFIAAMLKTLEGRKWLYGMIATGDIFTINFSVVEDPRAAAFREGKKFLPIQLFADARQAHPILFNQMMKEGEDNKWQPVYPIKGLV